MHKSKTPGHKGHGLTALTMVMTNAAMARITNMVTIIRVLLGQRRFQCGHPRRQCLDLRQRFLEGRREPGH